MANRPKSSKWLKSELQFKIDGFDVRVKRWGEIIISGDTTDRARLIRVRCKVASMAVLGNWPVDFNAPL